MRDVLMYQEVKLLQKISVYHQFRHSIHRQAAKSRANRPYGYLRDSSTPDLGLQAPDRNSLAVCQKRNQAAVVHAHMISFPIPGTYYIV